MRKQRLAAGIQASEKISRVCTSGFMLNLFHFNLARNQEYNYYCFHAFLSHLELIFRSVLIFRTTNLYSEQTTIIERPHTTTGHHRFIVLLRYLLNINSIKFSTNVKPTNNFKTIKLSLYCVLIKKIDIFFY